MYFIIMEPKSPVNTLIDDLIAAKERGVKVKVIIEDAKLGESLAAYNKLKDNGIDVATDWPGRRLHIKAVIIDGRYIFLGSANWSRAAIEDNYESTLFVESEQDAKELTKYIEELTVKQKKQIKEPGVSISADFILSSTKGRILLKKHAKKQFDLYLLLLKEYIKTGKTSFKLDEKKVVEEMGYKVPKEFGSYKSEQTFYHDTLRNFLKRLEQNKFIEYEKKIVTLKLDNLEKDSQIVIPFDYWEYEYANTLSMRAKYMYLIALYEGSRSITYPYWFHSQEDMSKLYGISVQTIGDGLRELERIGVLEVTRDKIRPPDFSARKANVYKLLPLKPITN